MAGPPGPGQSSASSKVADVGAWLKRAMLTGFGDPTAFHKFRNPGEDIRIPSEAELARKATLGALEKK